MSENEKSNFDARKFIGGIFSAAVMNIFLVIIWLAVAFNDMGYVGMAQWIFILPLAWATRKSYGGGYSAGLLVGAGLMLMLNSNCFGFPWEQKEWLHS